MAYELSEDTLYPLQTFKKGIDNPGDEQSLYEELKQSTLLLSLSTLVSSSSLSLPSWKLASVSLSNWYYYLP